MSRLSINPERTALVAIDLQNAIVSMPTAPYSAVEVVEKNRRIADALRAKGGLVVWVRVDMNRFVHLPVDEPSSLAGKQVPQELSQIAPSAGRVESDLLVTKHHWGAFAGTPLEQELRNHSIDTVLLTGISTNVGVESTLRQGTGLGFAFVVVEDACSAQDAAEHRHSIEKIFPRLARVRSAADLIEAIG